MNSEPTTYDFTYLKEWPKDKLREQLGTIMPVIDFLVPMYNAKDKVVKFELSCIDPRVNALKDITMMFDTVGASKFGFPDDLEIFIHNFCTFLCAQKMHIELLLSS
jgi:hypothetical protein